MNSGFQTECRPGYRLLTEGQIQEEVSDFIDLLYRVYASIWPA